MAEETIPSLVVRVKRKRSQLPTESLCIIQDDNEPSQKKALTTITNQIQQLNHQDNVISSTYNQKYMVLNRIDTIDSNSNAAVSLVMRDKDNKNNKRTLITTTTNNENTQDSSSNSNSMLFIPKKKTTLLSSYHSDCILLDMMQVDLATTSSTTTTTTSNNNDNSNIKTKILDPATRQLNGAILIANKMADFNGVSLAISHGANVNHRTTDLTGGLTALMVATMKCNLRMVKRLLGQCADVLVTNATGQTALDIARTLDISPDKFEVKLELQQWLYRATIQQRTKSSESSSTQDRMRRMLILARDQLGGSSAGDTLTDAVTAQLGGEREDEYVFDIFQCPSASILHSSSAHSTPSDPTTTPASYDTTTMPISCPVVPVEGLRFLADGGVELAFEYDSDWSALADEDTDSNAENNPANDYPDEEESEVEEQEEESDDSDDDVENKVYARSAYKNSKDNAGDDSDSEEGGDRFRPDLNDNIFSSHTTAGHKHKKNDAPRGTRTHARGHDSLLANLLGQDDEDEELPDMYQSQSVGRVLQPHVIGEGYVEGSGSGGQMVRRTTENIQRIWGEYDENDDNSDGEEEGAVTSYTRGNLHICHTISILYLCMCVCAVYTVFVILYVYVCNIYAYIMCIGGLPLSSSNQRRVKDMNRRTGLEFGSTAR